MLGGLCAISAGLRDQIAANVPRRFTGSFDDLVGAGENPRRDRQAQRMRGLLIHKQIELRRLLDRQISRLRL